MSTQLPPWVYDMVMDLQEWADTHPELYGNYFNGMHKVDNCGCRMLDRAPAEVRTQASAIRAYVASKEAAE